jgi:hypothetical protein
MEALARTHVAQTATSRNGVDTASTAMVYARKRTIRSRTFVARLSWRSRKSTIVSNHGGPRRTANVGSAAGGPAGT